MKAKILSIIKNEEIKNWQIFLLLVVFNLFLAIIMDTFFMTKETYQTLLSSRWESYQIDNFYMMIKRYSIYNYLLVPFILIIRAITVAMLIQLFFLFGNHNLKFKEVFRITLFGLIVLSLGSLIKMMWLISIPKEQITHKLLGIMPLSFSNLVNIDEVDKLMVGVLNSVNIFELIWLLVIGFLIRTLSNIKFTKSILYSFGVWIMIFLFQMGFALYLTRVLNA